jgi:hypothetical protein
MTDGELLRRSADGDETAFEVLYHRHRDAVYRFAWVITRSAADAEDAVQECFLTLNRRAAEGHALRRGHARLRRGGRDGPNSGRSPACRPARLRLGKALRPQRRDSGNPLPLFRMADCREIAGAPTPSSLPAPQQIHWHAGGHDRQANERRAWALDERVQHERAPYQDEGKSGVRVTPHAVRTHQVRAAAS